MKQLLVTLIILGAFAVQGNAQDQNVISAAGGSSVSSLGYISYTVGEPVVGGVAFNNGVILQGFESPTRFKAFNDITEDDEIKFTGLVTDNGNYLSWTISEFLEDAQYELLRSDDGVQFNRIAEFGDTGNKPSDLHTFFYIDTDVQNGLAYYLLNRVEADDNQSKSHVISLFRETYSLDENFDFEVYPNPAVDYLNISVLTGNVENAQLHLFEVSSRLLEKINIDLSTGQGTINLSEYRVGLYVLSIFDESGSLIGLEKIRKAD